MKEFNDGISTIDCHYIRPQFAAAFLLCENGRGIFVENNTAHSLPHLLRELELQKLSAENVDYLIVTHAHLDHAGGTSALLAHCKNAKVIGHPKAIKTLANPERLVQSAKKVYGEKAFKDLYGDLQAIPQSQLESVNDGHTLKWQNRTFTFFYTLGHASHHLCIFDSKSRGVFTGDSFGLCYPELQKDSVFCLPSTSPIDYDPTEAIASVQKVISFQPKKLFLTHFGEVIHIAAAQKSLIENLSFHEAQYQWALNHLHLEDKLSSAIEERLKTFYLKNWEFLKMDLKLNAQGIAFAAQKRKL